MGDWYELGLTVEMAFGYAPTETPTWTDVTDYVRAIPNIRRGRQSEYSAYAPGTATIVLDNRERRFDPEHASSPYAGDLVPMVPVRITTTTHDPLLDDDGQVLYSEANEWLYVTDASFPVFYGFVQGWPQAIGKGYTDSTVTVVAVDAFRILQQRRLSESAYRYEVDTDAPVAYWPFQSDYVNTVTGESLRLLFDTEFSSGSVTWLPSQAIVAASATYSYLKTDTLLPSAPRAIEVVIQGETSTGTVDWNIGVRSGDTDLIWLTIYDDSILMWWSNTALNKRLSGSAGSSVTHYFQPGRTYHVVVTVDDDYFSRFYVDGELVGTSSATATTGTNAYISETQPTLGLADTNLVAHMAVYDAPLSAARIAAHHNAGRFAWGGDFVERTGTRVGRVLDEIGWPTGWRDLSDGQSELGEYRPGSSPALSYLRELEQVEQGTIFVARDGDITLRDRQWHIKAVSSVTFADDYGTGLPFRDIQPDANTVDAIVNVAAVTWAGGTITDSDTTSVAAYEASSISMSPRTLKTLFDAQDLARWLIRLGKDPRTRITRLTVLPRADYVTLFPAILDLELGDVITVDITPLGVGAATEYSLAVQGIQHRITRDEWVTDLYLAPSVAGSGPYWTIGDATLGKVGAAFGNKVHY